MADRRDAGDFVTFRQGLPYILLGNPALKHAANRMHPDI